MKAESISAQARQFERRKTAYEARIEPHPDHAGQFRLSFPDAQAGLSVFDVSEGGVGLRSGIYIPKNMRLTLHILGVGGEVTETGEVLRIRVIARRCDMIDHKPTYNVGLQFADSQGADEQVLIRAASQASGASEAVVVEGSSGA
ncbi:MAG: PilZ domain-containing protein [Phycisphaerales bacterium]|nr:PilZ domain-containing protein [Phycisphaerales bacterium]